MVERFLQTLEPGDADELHALGRRRSYRPGDTLFLERDAGREVLAVPGPAFLAFIEATPAAGTHLLRMLSSRLRDADVKRLEFLSQDTVGRVCARLVELTERFGAPGPAGTRIDVPITQEELAGWTGSSREAVVKALRTLRELGWIATARSGITVLDVDAVRRRAA